MVPSAVRGANPRASLAKQLREARPSTGDAPSVRRMALLQHITPALDRVQVCHVQDLGCSISCPYTPLHLDVRNVWDVSVMPWQIALSLSCPGLVEDLPEA